jgi:hypothetical protein
MRFFMVALWVLSVFGFLYNLFTTYGNLTPHITFPLLGGFVSKDAYFFALVGLFMAFTYTFYFLNQTIHTLPRQLYLIPNRKFWLADKSHQKALNYLLINWNYGIAAVINYFCMYLMLMTEAANHYEGETDNALGWFYIPGLVMLASLILPFFRLLISKVSFIERK